MNYTKGLPMKPETKSKKLLNITKAKAKMWEYDIPAEYHIAISESPEKLFPLSIALLGDVAAEINRDHENTDSFKALKENLSFAADFFNSFHETRLRETLSPQLRLLASAAFYLCDMPGNTMVLARSIQYKDLSTESEGLGALLLWVLQSDITTQLESYKGSFSKYIVDLPATMSAFYQNSDPIKIKSLTRELREEVYKTGSDEQLLLGDLIAAVVSRKIKNASIRLLPLYTDIALTEWSPALQKTSFIREFWPAQRLLGETGLFRGMSAVVQMPTSAGKTKSIELVLRSSFLTKRTNLAIVVAPFRALCHEINDSLKDTFKDEDVGVDALSDILQNDFERELAKILRTEASPQVLVVTPEKLLYVLRHHPELANNLKLVIFDEGHQFDTGKRGITYELLLTSLKRYIPEDAQKVLISAVIPNAGEIAQWLNDDMNVAQGSDLFPTKKSIGFASWIDALGQIRYVDEGTDTFFVPRVIESLTLQKKGREKKKKKFPEKNNGQDVALFLGLKLCDNGGVAVFCGRKDTALSICKRLIDIVQRGYDVENLTRSSDKDELTALSTLSSENLGIASLEAQSANIGVLAHHNNIPHGIRIALEYAMRDDKIRFVVCTSTLAQGVNLPIRYLIVTSFQQGQAQIKVRDFHNLIGRAGRAGKHIEGSILLAEPKVYDSKTDHNESWRWRNAQSLLDFSQSEKIASSLLEVFEPIHNNRHGLQRQTISSWKSMEFFEAIVDAYINNQMRELSTNVSEEYGFDFDSVFLQIFQKQRLLESVENFLLAHWDEIASNPEEKASELAQQTLAYHLVDENKAHIVKVFQLLALNITEKIPEPERRKIFGKTLYGIHSSLTIEQWVNENQSALLKSMDATDFFEQIWTLFCSVIEANTPKGLFTKFDPADARKDILLAWLDGKSFGELLEITEQKGVKKIYGRNRRAFIVEDMVDLCENTFAFDGMLAIGAVIEFLNSFEAFDQYTIGKFQFFQKRLKYGLPTLTAISVYELGFSDRVLAQKIATSLNDNESDKNTILSFIRKNDIEVNLPSLPSYYKNIFNSLRREGR
jgi:superfamily II DNA/RNA helicase